jgi:hypothetical protein
MSGGGAF